MCGVCGVLDPHNYLYDLQQDKKCAVFSNYRQNVQRGVIALRLIMTSQRTSVGFTQPM